jgi:hypothetical protein
MSDIFKIKRAHFLQVESVHNFAEKPERIAKIFKVFFSEQNPNTMDYLLNFPQTSAMIDNNQNFFMRSLQTLVMLDNDGLAALASEGASPCVPTSAIAGFVCGLHMPNQFGTSDHFVNFLMNEYLQYRLFIDFYTEQQQKRIALSTNQAQQFLFNIELKTLSDQRKMYGQALRVALEDFQDFVVTYPLHVGFVWYQEQLLRFRDDYAAKMVTPFYSLYEKLRNVQPPEKK